MSEALQLLNRHQGTSKIIAGGTDLWLEKKNGIHKDIENYIDISRIAKLDSIWVDNEEKIHIGPLVTHSHCVRSELLKESAFCLYQACLSVGSPQIRNRGTVVGNIVTGSPANDTISALMALDATIVVSSVSGTREIPINKFYLGVRRTVLQPNEIVTDILIKKLDRKKSQSIFLKQGLRKAQAISLINISILVILNSTNEIDELRIVLGSVAPTVIRCKSAEEYAKGQKFEKLNLELTKSLVEKDISPITDIRSTSNYRTHMAGILFERGYKNLGKQVGRDRQREVTLWGNQKSTYKPLLNLLSTKTNEKISFDLNGQKRESLAITGQSLLDVIREQLGLTGTKEGCGEGECGACTVFMDGIAVLACLIPAQRAENSVIETIEYLSSGNEVNKVQKAFIEENAVQCGYCTPGFIMSGTKLIEEITDPTIEEIKTAISGNLCRCTGYYKIVDAIQKAAEMSQEDA
jgi:carbon-monoxide dehydrogenase medium subunit